MMTMVVVRAHIGVLPALVRRKVSRWALSVMTRYGTFLRAGADHSLGLGHVAHTLLAGSGQIKP